MCKRALVFSAALTSVRRAAPVCVVSTPALELCRLPKASPPCGCLPAGRRPSCPLEVPDESCLSVDRRVLPHPFWGPCALQDQLVRRENVWCSQGLLQKHVNSGLWQDSELVREYLQLQDSCQQVFEPVGCWWLDPSSTKGHVCWLPGAWAWMCVQTQTAVLSSVCRERPAGSKQLESFWLVNPNLR